MDFLIQLPRRVSIFIHKVISRNPKLLARKDYIILRIRFHSNCRCHHRRGNNQHKG